MKELRARALALRALADLLASGFSARAALIGWWREAPRELQPSLLKLARRISLGAPTRRALQGLEEVFDRDAPTLRAFVCLHVDFGADLALMLEGLAQSLERRAEAEGAARAACAGALLSGRLVAGLAFVFVPLMPVSHAPLFDAEGLLLLALGITFAGTGLEWMRRLVPRPPEEDLPALAAEAIAAILRAGVGVRVALDAIADHWEDGVGSELEAARRRIRLGATCAHALARCGEEGLRRVGEAIGRMERMGLPVADALDEVARARRDERHRALEAAIRRSPVLMVVPLVVCVLPSFVLLGLAPFLRGVSLSP